MTFTSNALTIAQTARMVGVTHKAVRKRIAAGGLVTTPKDEAGRLLVSKDSARAWVRERQDAARLILAGTPETAP